jgi:hypothetical protein
VATALTRARVAARIVAARTSIVRDPVLAPLLQG